MKISIRWALILGCLGLIWGMQILITSSIFFSSQRVLAGHARDIMQNIADLTIAQSGNHLQLAQGVVDLTKRLMASDVVNPDFERYELLERYFLDQLSQNSHLAGVYVGAPNGDFFYVSRTNNQKADGYRTKIISHTAGERQTKIIWRDNIGALLSQEIDRADTYDPRQRPWYQKAMTAQSVIWTDPYIFFTSQQPGITVAEPIYHAGGQLRSIIGVDIEINQLSTFIGKLRIGKNGNAFLLNSNRDVVAFPDVTRIKHKDLTDNGRMRMVKIEELDDDLSKTAFQAVDWDHDSDGRLVLDHPEFAQFVFDEETYNTMFAPFSHHQWPWIIGVYLPENDYLGALKDNRRFNYLVALVLSVVATLIGLRLSRKIIKPLVGLEKEALAIKQQDLSAQFDTRSALKEIDETSKAFALMKTSLRNSEEKYRRIFENIQDIYYESTIDGIILEVSPSVEKMAGVRREKLIGNSIDCFYSDLKDRKTLLNELLAYDEVRDWEVKLKNIDGCIEYGSVTTVLKRDFNGKPEKFIGSLRIITDRKKADLELRQYQDQLEILVKERTHDLEKSNEQLRSEVEARKEKEWALLRSEEKYRSIIENMSNGYYEMDLKGNLIFFNEPLVEILGYSNDELLGLSYLRFIAPETAGQVKTDFKSILKNRTSVKSSRYTIVRKDGDQRTVEASVALITFHDGRAMGFRGVVLDVSERLNAENEKAKLEERMQQIQRLEGIGTLAGGVAHDFNNLLMGIQGSISLMMTETDPSNYFYGKLKSIEDCVSSGSKLTRQLLGFARGGKYMVKPLDFNQIVTNTARMFGRTRKEIRMVEKIDDGLWTVMADQSQIEQVLLNIYINAWQAMPDGGNIYVETRNIVLDEKFVSHFEILPGRYVCISISDTGIGMDETVQQRIFEPFFTTKEMGRGTGLGMASAYGIIKNHDGAIDFVSRVGEGTTFYIYLPASYEAAEKEPTAQKNIIQGSETILLVDDEQIVLDVSVPMLEAMGYRVIAATGGKQALEIYRRIGQDIDLVMLDMIMPEFGGGAVFDHLKSINPDVKVLLSSGYSLSGQAEEILARGCSGFIQKPYSLEQISKKIRDILDSYN